MLIEGAPKRKSTKSQTSNCLEVALQGGQVVLTNSRFPNGTPLAFTPSEWNAFLEGAKDGEFDLA